MIFVKLFDFKGSVYMMRSWGKSWMRYDEGLGFFYGEVLSIIEIVFGF